MSRVALWLWCIGLALTACCFVAWFVMHLPVAPVIRGLTAPFYEPPLLAVGLVLLGAGFVAWARAWARSWRSAQRTLPLLALLLGIAMIAVTGYRELRAGAATIPQIPHALIGVGAVTLLVLGLYRSSSAFVTLADAVGLSKPERRMGRVVRFIAYAALAVGVLVPFAPRFFGDTTPRDCAVRVAATGALVFAIPLAAAAILALWSVFWTGRRRSLVVHCLQCGYPRPSAARCPECGVRGTGPGGSV
mgnify:CR=1 FL=1